MTRDSDTTSVNSVTGSIDTAFDALRSPSRRRILFALSEYGLREPEELTLHSFVSMEGGGKEPDVSKILLYHTHLPKLADMGYVEWTPNSETIRRGPRFDEIEPLLGIIMEHGDDLPYSFP